MNVKKDYNPKGLGLFLSGYCNLYTIDPKPEYMETIRFLIDKIIHLQTTNYSGSCWGYNFDWQARMFFQPKYTPTIVATSFIANALLDAFEIIKEPEIAKIAISSCDFILKDLNRTPAHNGFLFSYSPLDKTSVYNASLLGAGLLARSFSITNNMEYLQTARSVIASVCELQNEDGSWYNANEETQRWIDNFHTGYNLECINNYQLYTGDLQFDLYLKKGFDYYINTFFTEKGESKYYNNQLYPIDIHSCSQLFITLYKLNALETNKNLFEHTYNWTTENLLSPKGFFYYQKKNFFTNKIPYMRWSQAWMFYALSLIQLYKNGMNYTILRNPIDLG